MSAAMKAWQFHATNEPLVLADVPVPRADPGDVVIDVKAAGLCHSDVGILTDEGWQTRMTNLPVVLGHENAGVIVEVGEGVDGWQVGDRVGVHPMTPRGTTGIDIDGGFAERMAAPAASLLRIPEGVSWELAAVATDAGMTSHAAVIGRGGVREGMAVGIIGLGGVGQVGARIAVLAGATVYAAEVNQDVWPEADRLGLAGVKPSIGDFEGVDFDVIVDFAGFGTTTAEAIEAVRVGGTVVQVGMGKLESTISTKALIFNQAHLVGSRGGRPEDITGVYEFLATGQLAPTVSTIGFDQVDAGYRRLQAHDVVGRLVAVR